MQDTAATDTPTGTDVTTRIVVLDRGFVYVGNVSQGETEMTITNARCIRRWGTTKGLGELVDGPKPNTVLDPAGTVIVPNRAIIHSIVCSHNW